jgi:nicotinamide-nucleotide amidase
MWHDWVLPRLQDRGIGQGMAIRTLRTTGIGESQLAELLGEPLLRATNPSVATYARQDAVDIRISAVGTVADNGPARTAAQLADAVESLVLDLVDKHVWARGDTTWAQAVDAGLERLGWTLAIAEVGTRGALMALLADMDRLVLAESHADGPASEAVPAASGTIRYDPAISAPIPDDEVNDALLLLAQSIRERAASDAALAVRVTARGDDTSVEVVVATAAGVRHERRLAFLRGTMGRHRAAITAASLLLANLPGAPRPAAGT